MKSTHQAAAWQPRDATQRPLPGRFGSDLKEWLRGWQPPLDRREFWGVQLLVLLIAGAHLLLELSVHPRHGGLAFIPSSLFLIPVVYAALNFGLHGSLPTAIWCALVTVPNVLLFHGDGDWLGEIWQIGLVIAVAIFVGQRVDREKGARRQAEEREDARRVSEEKYRGIFDNVAEPILLLDQDGVIEAANEAAGSLLSTAAADLSGRRLRDVVGPDLMAAARDANGKYAALPLATPASARPVWIEPVLIPISSADGQVRTQLMLRDLTAQHERQAELEAYARRTNAAREEEAGRIARELHDGPVQTLVLLWRRLDGIRPLDDPAEDAELRAAQDAARTAADELRRVSRDLRPSILHDLGLTTALRAEVTQFARRSGIVGRFASVGPERRLAADRELALLRIVQEALRNVEQHARARRVSVRLLYQPSQVRVIVADDGEGLTERSPSELVADGKLGLIGMKEQARLIGADLSIGAKRRGGTTITLTVTT